MESAPGFHIPKAKICRIPESLTRASFITLINCVASVFRVVSEQRKTEERRGTGFSVLAAVFDTRSWLFAPKRHGNACYAG